MYPIRGLLPSLGLIPWRIDRDNIFYGSAIEYFGCREEMELGTTMAGRMNKKAWDDFVFWCQRRCLNPVPANPWTLAAYVRWCESRMTPRMIAKAIREIDRVHESKTRKRIHRDPLVKRTLKMIEARSETVRDRPKLDLFDDSLTTKPRQSSKKTTYSNKAPQRQLSKSASASRLKRGLNSRPRLVSRRNLGR